MNSKVQDYLTKAFAYARQAFDRCFHNLDTGAPADRCAALAMAAACTAQYAAAASVYLSSTDIYDDNILGIFRQFEVFTNEVRIVYHQEKPNVTTLFLEMERLESLLAERGFDA